MKAMFFFESAEECCAKYFGPKVNGFQQEWCEKVDVCPNELLPVSSTREPTNQPTSSPPKETRDNATSSPTKKPSAAPTSDPTRSPTTEPTAAPSVKPSLSPSAVPSVKPSGSPSSSPSAKPSSSNEPEIIIPEVLVAPDGSERTNLGSKSSKAANSDPSQSYPLQEARFSAPSIAPSSSNLRHSTPRCSFCPAGIPNGEVKPQNAQGKTCNEIQVIAAELEPQWVSALCESVIQKEESICCPNQPSSSASQAARRTLRSGRSRRR